MHQEKQKHKMHEKVLNGLDRSRLPSGTIDYSTIGKAPSQSNPLRSKRD